MNEIKNNLTCPKCGLPLLYANDRLQNRFEYSCLRCRYNEEAPRKDRLVKAAKYANNARNAFWTQQFGQAEEMFRNACVEAGSADEAVEYRWGALMSKYGIRYCFSDVIEKTVVNFWKKDLPDEPICASKDFKQLLRQAYDYEEKGRAYTESAQEIDRCLEQIRTLESKKRRFDVFFSVKLTDENQDDVAELPFFKELYYRLLAISDNRLRIFFSNITLEGCMVEDYEGFIYNALRTSKVLVMMTPNAEYPKAPWVMSEWKRFDTWFSGDSKRELMTGLVGNVSAKALPSPLNMIQCQLSASPNELNRKNTVNSFAQTIYASVRRCEENEARYLAEKGFKTMEEAETADRLKWNEAYEKDWQDFSRRLEEGRRRAIEEEERARRAVQEEADRARKAREEAERKVREEAERRAKEEAERKAKEEAERRAIEEAKRKAKEEAERKAKEEAERKAKQDAERRAKEEAERRAKEDAERKAKEDAERRAKEEAERKAKQDAERRAKEEAERKAKEDAERKARQDAERKAKEEAERRHYIDNVYALLCAELKAKEEAERKAKETRKAESGKSGSAAGGSDIKKTDGGESEIPREEDRAVRRVIRRVRKGQRGHLIWRLILFIATLAVIGYYIMSSGLSVADFLSFLRGSVLMLFGGKAG